MPAEVSIYAHAKTSRSSGVSPFADVLQRISSGEFEGRISHLRTMPPDDYKREKLNLPMFTTSGVFHPEHRTVTGFQRHSGLAMLDFDGIDDLESVFASACAVSQAAAAFRSPSGAGFKVVVAVRPVPETADDHKKAFNRAVAIFEENLPVSVDRSGSDVSRTCFFSHDSQLFTNRRADPVMWCRDDVLGNALDHIDGTDRDDWLKVTMGLHRLAHDRSDDHYREVWEAWSAQFDGYDRGANDSTWESLKADGNETGALGRNGIIELAESFGFERPLEQHKQQAGEPEDRAVFRHNERMAAMARDFDLPPYLDASSVGVEMKAVEMMKVFASERLAKWDGSAYVRGGNALWRKLGDTVNPKSAEVIKSLMMDAMEKGAERGAEMIAEKG